MPQDEQFFPASSGALLEEALPPEVQGLTSNPLYSSLEISEAESSSAAQLHDLSASSSTPQSSPRVNTSSQGTQANKRGAWRWGL